MTKNNGESPQKTEVKVSLIGGHRLAGATLHERTVTASLIGGADIDLTDVDIPDSARLRITKLSLIGGVTLRVRRDVRVEVRGLRLGGVKDDGPSEPGGPTVRIDAWGLVGGVSVHRS
ncbi:hypothetical protein QF032_000312 [Streptomyces achromogenes]|uniref:Cell wall-active antibiotics response LiaF-like C-terminal domain-containing protein n=1 Tax=Streptomyces achromogenes TaxID=67255 RepID=A0ABU0PSF4_STRAH|nr:hypothetical protein [Streptomyces achromogenes]MDQ0681318.1 hypothetical protein [Streptomyces achromogenes]MDQ0828468.1 hypothetical protein [Streptomyces achromogenes]